MVPAGRCRAVCDELREAVVKCRDVGPGVEHGAGVGSAPGRFLKDEGAQGEDYLPVEHGVVVASEPCAGSAKWSRYKGGGPVAWGHRIFIEARVQAGKVTKKAWRFASCGEGELRGAS